MSPQVGVHTVEQKRTHAYTNISGNHENLGQVKFLHWMHYLRVLNNASSVRISLVLNVHDFQKYFVSAVEIKTADHFSMVRKVRTMILS